MPTANLGRVRPIYRGAYSDTFAYTPLDFFSFADSTFFCVKAATGIAPPNTEFYTPIVDASSFVRASQLAALLNDSYLSLAADQTLTAEQRSAVIAKLHLEEMHAALTPFAFAAEAGQTIFALGMSPSANACIISMNGAWLTGGGIDYSIAGSTLTLTAPAVVGDRIAGVAIASFAVANALLPAANLADLANVVAAQNNLGLRSAATKAAGDPSLMPSGSVIGRAYAETAASTVYNSIIPFDASPPQITEGVEIISTTYTPKIVGSKLRITFGGVAQVTTAGQPLAAATFLNGGVNAIDTTVDYHYSDGDAHRVTTCFEVAPSGLEKQTIAVRAGTGGGGSFKFNAQGGGTFGGTLKTTLIVEEIAP